MEMFKNSPLVIISLGLISVFLIPNAGILLKLVLLFTKNSPDSVNPNPQILLGKKIVELLKSADLRQKTIAETLSINSGFDGL
jgi:hypothetical protein